MGNVLCGLPRTPGQRLRRSKTTIPKPCTRRKNWAGGGAGEVQRDNLDRPGRVENIEEPEVPKEPDDLDAPEEQGALDEPEDPQEREEQESHEVQEAHEEPEVQGAAEEPEERGVPKNAEDPETPNEPEDREAPGNPLGVMEDLAAACKNAILLIFPDICPNYLETLAAEHEYDHEQLITHILDQIDNNRPYPKRQRSTLKRKRSDEKEGEAKAEEESKKFDNPDRRQERKGHTYFRVSKSLLIQAFPYVRVGDVDDILKENNDCLFPAFIALNGIVSGQQPRPGFHLKKQRSRDVPEFRDDQIENTMRNTQNEAERSAIEEFQAARSVVRERLAKLDAERKSEQEEQENADRAKAEGTMADCECCYNECPLNRMVHCDGETFHWFCRSCAKQMTETQIGLSKYHLACMSMGGCTAGFSRDQRDIFLDNKLIIALDRIEQEAVLRMAGIENLETCPFCPFAAECPPVEIDREFTCQNPECEMVSCRMCRRETHIPKTCDEAAKDAGLSARRVIEEAMSAALIRTCNKCNTPFIKENGCNKMTCTRNGCYNVQCYICHKSCDYAHFNDKQRGGKEGNCPLFDKNVEQRHEDEVQAAEEQARKQLADEHPEVEVELLEVKVSDKVKQDDQKRKANILAGPVPPPARARGPPAGNRAIILAAFHGDANNGIVLPAPPPDAVARQNLRPALHRNINHNAAGGIAPPQAPAQVDAIPFPRVGFGVPPGDPQPPQFALQFMPGVMALAGNGRPEWGNNQHVGGFLLPEGNQVRNRPDLSVRRQIRPEPLKDLEVNFLGVPLERRAPLFGREIAAAPAAPVAPQRHQPGPAAIAFADRTLNEIQAAQERVAAQTQRLADLGARRNQMVDRARRGEVVVHPMHFPHHPRPDGGAIPEPQRPLVVPPPALGWRQRRSGNNQPPEVILLDGISSPPAPLAMHGPFAPNAEARAAHRSSANPSVGRGPVGFGNP